MPDGVRYRIVEGKVYIRAEDIVEELIQIKKQIPDPVTIDVVGHIQDYFYGFLQHQK